jgi:hypothetical protein
MGKTANLDCKGGSLAAHFTDVAAPLQNAVLDIRPVGQEKFHAGSVILPADKIVLRNAFVGQRAVEFAPGCGKTEARFDFRSLETGARAKQRSVEGQIFIVIGEAEYHAVAARNAPAVAERGRAGCEMRA